MERRQTFPEDGGAGRGGRVTWLLPVLNGMPYLHACLESLARQTYTDFVVLAWDNGSDDGSVEVLRAWIPGRLPGRVVTGQAAPLGSCLAAMVEAAETELCARMDADDVCEPPRLSEQVAFLAANPGVALVGTQMRRMDPAGQSFEVIGPLPRRHEDIVGTLLSNNPVSHPTVLFRRSAVLGVGNYRYVGAVNVEDYDLWLRLAACHRLANLGRPLLSYRVHPRSSTQQSTAEGRLAGAMTDRFAEHASPLFGLSPVAARRLRERRCGFAFGYAWRIAGRLGGGGRARMAWLRGEAFIDAMVSLTSPRDVASRVLFVLLDRRPGRAVRLARELVLRGGLGPLAAALRRVHASRAERAWWGAWRAAVRTAGSDLDNSTEFAGARPSPDRFGVGQQVRFERDVTVWLDPEPGPRGRLRVSDRVYVGRNTYIGVHEDVAIGRDTIIGAYTYIVSGNHAFASRAVPIRDQGFVGAPVAIGDDVWIGTHVVILPGVTIGRGAVIGAGSVVNRDVPPYEIWGGVPARFLKQRL